MGNNFQDVIHMEYQVRLRYTGESQVGVKTTPFSFTVEMCKWTKIKQDPLFQF